MVNLQWRREFYTAHLIFWLPFLPLFVVPGIITALLAYPMKLWPGALLAAVLVNIVLMGLTLVLVMVTASHFVRDVYKLDSLKEASNFLLRSKFGMPGMPPNMLINKNEIASAVSPNDVLTRIGGPSRLAVRYNTAVVLQQGGRLSRIVGKGLHLLEPFENIYEMVDLRPRRGVGAVGGMTKEGLPVEWEYEIWYQIDDGNQKASVYDSGTPYPFLDSAVFSAVTGKWIKKVKDVDPMNWETRTVGGLLGGGIRAILAERPLDELIGITADKVAIREFIRRKLEPGLHANARNLGVKILRFNLHNLSVKDEVTSQWIKTWQARWQPVSGRIMANTQARIIKEHEPKKAESTIDFIKRISKSLEDLGSKEAITAVTLMRFFSTLEQTHYQLGDHLFVPKESLDMLAGLEDILGDNLFKGAGSDS